MHWADAAACLDEDLELFFPGGATAGQRSALRRRSVRLPAVG